MVASMRALVGGQSRWLVNVTRCTLIGYRPALHARLATINLSRPKIGLH